MQKRNEKKKIIAICSIILAIVLMAGVYLIFGKDTDDGVKKIKFEVDAPVWSAVFELETEAEFLEDAMKEIDDLTYETKDGMVMVVNGVRADYNLDGAYWAIYVNDEYGNYGIAEQPLKDGDTYRIEYTKAS